MLTRIFPIFPVPITPTVFPCMSKPINAVDNEKSPVLVLLNEWLTLRFNVIIKVSACSATAYGEYAGTRATEIPNVSQALISTLLNPKC